jgi:hypothetical protein
MKKSKLVVIALLIGAVFTLTGCPFIETEGPNCSTFCN